MKTAYPFSSVLKLVGMILALIGLILAMPGVAQADIEITPAGIVSAGTHATCALRPSGAIECWGFNPYGAMVNQPGPFTQVNTNDYHTCALTPSGAAECWGPSNPSYDNGQAEDQPGPYVYVDGGVWHTCALTPDGAVDCWGANDPSHDFGQAADQTGPYVQLSVGLNHNCALTPDGVADCWGWNAYGQAVDHTGPYTEVGAGVYQTCGLTTGRAVDCWGGNNYGQAEDKPGPYIQISVGGYHNCGLTPNGAVDCWGWDYNGQVSGTGGDNISRFATHPGPYTRVSAGYFHTCGLKPGGAVDCWGEGGYLSGRPGPYGPFDPSPFITTQPQSQTVTIDDTVRFSAAASGWPEPTLQWQVSADSGNTWMDVSGATASPLEFIAGLDQSGTQYRAVFSNIEGSATSDVATLTVNKKTALVTLPVLSYTYDGQPKSATATTDPAGLVLSITYDGSVDAPSAAGDYQVVATVVDNVYQGSASGRLTIAQKEASVTPEAASKTYGQPDPVLSGILAGFIESDNVTAIYNRTPGESAGDYIISAALSPSTVLNNYAITYNTAAFTTNQLAINITADGKSKLYGQADPKLTYTYSPQLVSGDVFSGALTRDPGEEVGTYTIRQGTLTLSDNYALTFTSASLTILPANTAPTANPGGPYLGAVNTPINFDGSLSSDPENDPLTYAWTFGDDSATGVAPAHTYTSAGLHTVCLTVNDGSLDSGPACTLAVVYDPSAGFVTGGGWITSPAGAYQADPSLTGKATFGFVSRYQKGASIPTGTTAFQFDLAGLSFSSTSYDWLVVNQATTNAQFKGSGLINGAADPNGNAYKFMIWAGDGSPDTFRIRIWWEDTAGEQAVYDNGVAQAIGGGNIVVHTSK